MMINHIARYLAGLFPALLAINPAFASFAPISGLASINATYECAIVVAPCDRLITTTTITRMLGVGDSFDETARAVDAVATQQTSLRDTRLEIFLSAVAPDVRQGPAENASALSSLELDFEVIGDTNNILSFAGVLSESGVDPSVVGFPEIISNSGSGIRLTGPTSFSWDSSSHFGHDELFYSETGPLNLSIALLTGSYLLEIFTRAHAEAGFPGAADMTLTVSFIPLPSAVWLFGATFTGLIGLSIRNLRRNQSGVGAANDFIAYHL